MRSMIVPPEPEDRDPLPTASPGDTDARLERIVSAPDICGGRPCIRGTRMRVSDLLELMASGARTEEILEDFPYLAAEDIQAALAYAARSADHRVIKAA